ncbi:PREDICTED: defensin-like protein 87 [Camelina sativa]|uniref:Defensin-like protein 87 n=1 Tax=Camelina sativa TaxID=90675 RepID=A0ABM1Q9Q0_CAMSA|nr:PREDICTED: defensin-like protein 87 [Camelina sativa]XP_019083489.1 PREDICTED: defensin-like protein 87 [Camelina sativa]
MTTKKNLFLLMVVALILTPMVAGQLQATCRIAGMCKGQKACDERCAALGTQRGGVCTKFLGDLYCCCWDLPFSSPPNN